MKFTSESTLKLMQHRHSLRQAGPTIFTPEAGIRSCGSYCHTACRGDNLTGKPVRVIGCQENGDASDVVGLTNTAEWRWFDSGLVFFTSEDALALCAFRL